MIAEVGHSVFLEERAHGFQRLIAEVGVLERGDGGLRIGVGVELILLHEEFDEFHRFFGVLGVCADGQHHIVACGEDLFTGVIGGRHLGETKFNVRVDEQDLWNGVGTERNDCGLALGEVLRALLVGDASIGSGVGEEFGFLLDCGFPQFLECGLALLELSVLRLGNQRTGQRGERGLGGPGVGHCALQRIDAGILEGVEHVGELGPRGRWVLRVETYLAEQRLVVDVTGGVAGKGQTIQALLGGIGGLHQVFGDLHHAGVEGVHDGLVGEVVENTGCGEVAEADVAVEGDYVRHAVLDEAGA